MKPTFTITIQANYFDGQKVAYQVSQSKAKQVLGLLQPEEEKLKRRIEKRTTTLDQFFS